MKVLLISFQENSDVIGVKYLHAYLRAHGHASAILLVPNDRPATVGPAFDHAVGFKPEIVGLSAMSYEFARARRFADDLKERLPGIPFVFGGVHATAAPEECLRVADAVVRGEGEETLLELIECLEQGTPLDALDGVQGLVFKRGSECVHTPVRPPIHDIDSLPFPGHLPDEMHVAHGRAVRPIREPAMYRQYARYQGRFLSIVSSRGCPNACTYCFNSILREMYGGNPVRERSPKNVMEEISEEVKAFHKMLYINFQDDCFMLHPDDWMDTFSEAYGREIGIPFIVRTTPRYVTKDKLSILKQAGLRWVFMGLQTGSDRVNEEVYRRHITAENFLEAARTVSELNLCPWYDVILDNPYETEEEHFETIGLLLRTPKPFQFDLFSLDYFPGTEIRRMAARDGIPMPSVGEKSYTAPEACVINMYTRMTASLPAGVVRALLRVRGTLLGRVLAHVAYWTALAVEPAIYLWLVAKSNDFRVLRTASVVRAFSFTAFRKLFLRHQG